MWAVLQSFEERVEEVEKYLRVLEKLEDPSVVLFDKSTKREKRVFEEGSLKVMKATVFLLLYNLVESSIRSAFGELYTSILNSGRPACELKTEFRKLWIKQRYGAIDLDSASTRTFRELTEALIEEITLGNPITLEEGKLPVSGNLDSDSIRNVCRFHGITPQIHKQAFGGGEQVVGISLEADFEYESGNDCEPILRNRRNRTRFGDCWPRNRPAMRNLGCSPSCSSQSFFRQ